ncbi:RidA family protein [Bacillus sp. FJAT-45350]|uniref:RidA family protein n=1 Tax=Bacillus sp. FJAT-45350 TaxID=2011014 RepID=UPI000BB67A18|nr:RidA family protein [Bacillus sp. FJAT-45350]
MIIVEDVEKRIDQLNIKIPELPKQSGNYLLAKQYGNLLYISGVTCKWDGAIPYKGKVGEHISVEEGYEAAKICAINHLAVIKSMTGDLNSVNNIIKLVGYVNCHANFGEIPKVINGASDLLIDVYGERGKHARCAVGVNSLPGTASVETEMIVELK